MTAEQRERQILSFAYGNLSIEQPGVTREQIEAAAHRGQRSRLGRCGGP